MSLTTIKKDVTIGTVSGRIFHPFSPRKEEVHMPDVIHSLSNKIRWNGHITERYTVAQHSVEVMKYVRDHDGSYLDQFYGLLHDTLEAYCVDMPKPIKICIPQFCELEETIWACICDAHKIDSSLPTIVEEGDKWQLIREAVAFFPEIPNWVYKFGKETIYKAIADDPIKEVWDYNRCVAEFTSEYERLRAVL